MALDFFSLHLVISVLKHEEKEESEMLLRNVVVLTLQSCKELLLKEATGG